jgi:multiple sugar transport system ATP-binding protein
MAKVVLKNIQKKYDEIEVVKNFNLEIKDQEMLILVGPSGCGKSTTLRMIAGLEEITAGELYIGDTLVNDVSPKDRNIAMVFQNYALYPHMSVYDNIAFSLKLKNFPKKEIDSKVRNAAKILKIEELLERKPKALSGGQRQRVAMGRAIVRDPSVFLMDEPLSNLDAKLRVTMRTEIARLHKRLKATIIYVTHDQIEAMTMGDRIVVMKDGIVQQVDTPMNVYEHPNNLFVAGFIGSPTMNFMEAVVEFKEENLWLKGDGFNIIVPQGFSEKLQNYKDRTIIMGIRPDNVRDEPLLMDTYPDAKIKVRVDVVENLGSETLLYVMLQDHLLVAKVNLQNNYSVGDEIELVFDVNHLYAFDMETQNALI